MISISTDLATLFASSNEFVKADCYTFALSNGTVLRYTTFDTDLTYGLKNWLANGPVFDRSSTRIAIGLEVGTLQVYISPKDADLIGSQTWLQAVCSGVLDNADVTLEVAFMAPGSFTPAGMVMRFFGKVAQLATDRFVIDMTANDPTDELNRQMPRNIYQAGCQHTLYDTGCGVAKATYTKTGTVVSSPTVTSFAATITGAASGTLDLGVLQFTSGALAGTRRSVKQWNGSVITLLNPLPLTPAPGDAFSVTYGCDKTLGTCNGRFANQVNFKGFPFVPSPEAAV